VATVSYSEQKEINMRKDFIDAAWDLLQQIPNREGLKFLELSCGDAFFLERLVKEGVSATGTTYHDRQKDYIRGRDYPEGVHVDGGIDLNKPLPYADNSFDVVYSTEVIEHLEGHRNFITESARVLKPDGWFVMTTPNLHRLISRIHFALTGVHLVKCPIFQVSEPLDRMEEFHHHCVDFVVLHWLMWNSGLRIEKMVPGYVHPVSRVLNLVAPLLRGFIKPALQRYYPKDFAMDEARKDMLRWMSSKTLLGSENICLLARKTGPTFANAPGTSTYYRKS
jgi:SAM-dependent methyltransferase